MNIENIAAIASPLGVGGIGIIRISGVSSINTVNNYLKKSILKQEANTIIYNKFMENNVVIDEVLVSVFKGPKSFTGEDIVEINCHGGIYITNKILEILLKNDNIRLAEPGEFSKRAFINGKKNLIQLETAVNVIEAKTKSSYDINNFETLNKTQDKLIEIKDELLDIIGQIEVKLDYPEYVDIKEINESDCLIKLYDLKTELDNIIEDSKKGQLIINGLKTVIIGAPNAGKSSLLNCLAKQNKAIVSDIRGTTRDIVETEVNLGKIVLHLLDTAGIHQTNEVIESLGIEKSLKLIDEAQLILLVIDINEEISEEILKIYEENKDKIIVLLNKCDDNKIHTKNLENEIAISVKNNYNIDLIQDYILEKFNIDDNLKNNIILTNIYHISKLNNAKEAIELAIVNLENELDIDLVNIDLKNSLYELGEILNTNIKSDILNHLFSNYCLGK